MKYNQIITMFQNNPHTHYLDVIINKKTAQLFLDNGFKIVKVGECNYEIYRRVN